MRRSWIRTPCVSVLGASLLLISSGCPCLWPEEGHVPPPGTLVSGRLTVRDDSGADVIIEQELNDSVGLNQFVRRLSGGDAVTVLGDVSSTTGDTIDAFEFIAQSPMIVEVHLSYSNADADLDLYVDDLETSACISDVLGGSGFTLCFVTANNPESGSFVEDDRFVLIVSAATGGSEYQLDVSVAEAGEATDGDVGDILSQDYNESVLGKRRETTERAQALLPEDQLLTGELLVVFHENVSNDLQHRFSQRGLASTGYNICLPSFH